VPYIVAGALADAEEIDAEWLRAAVLRSEPVPRAPASAGRNLLLVVVDTLRADHMSVYGYGRDTTPNLKRLAEESAVFERAISQSSWTMPATASLLTGLQPPEHGVTDGQALEPRFDTLAEALQAAGLTTFAVSANPVVGREEGFDQGFERFVHLPWARAGHVGAAFRAFVEESRGRRWFAYLHYVDPHDPYDAPGAAGRAFTGGLSSRYARVAEFRKLFHAVNFGRGEAPLSERDLAYLEAAYDGEILYWDQAFGRLVDELRGLGSLDDTVVVVTSDHGEEFMDHGRLKHAHQLYEESIWVPLIVRAPGLVDAGRHSRPLETRRLFDAIRGWMTAEKRGADGLLATPGPIFSQTSHNFLHEGRRRNELAAVRDGDWKLIWSPRTESVELYHLSEDPGEQADRSAAEPERRDRYRELLGRWLARGGADEEGQPAEATVEELRALGYVQ
jgi:arylsulfatase A-like enzyme